MIFGDDGRYMILMLCAKATLAVLFNGIEKSGFRIC